MNKIKLTRKEGSDAILLIAAMKTIKDVDETVELVNVFIDGEDHRLIKYLTGKLPNVSTRSGMRNIRFNF